MRAQLQDADASPSDPLFAEAPSVGFAERIHFNEKDDVLDVDFSHFTFDSVVTVRLFFNEIQKRIEAVGKPCYLVIDFHACQIFPEAWFEFAHRSRVLRERHVLGSVRYDVDHDSGAAPADARDPDMRADRASALARVAELRAEARRPVRPPRPF